MAAPGAAGVAGSVGGAARVDGGGAAAATTAAAAVVRPGGVSVQEALHQLVVSFVGGGADGGGGSNGGRGDGGGGRGSAADAAAAAAERDRRVEAATRLCGRLLGATLGPPPTLRGEEPLVRAVAGRLARAGQPAQAAAVTQIAARLRVGGVVRHRWALLHVLSSLRDDGDAAAGLPPVFADVEPPAAPAAAAVGSRTGAGGAGAAPFPPAADAQGAEEVAAYRDALAAARSGRPAVSEAALVRDALLAVQGVDGRLSRWDERRQRVALRLDPGTYVSPPVRDLFLHIVELGFLYRRIIDRTARAAAEEGRADAPPAGQRGGGAAGAVPPPPLPGGTPDGSERSYVSRAFAAAVGRELDAYFRSLAAVEAEASPPPGGGGGGGGPPLTLRRLFVWATREAERLRWLARLCDETRGLVGGQLLTLLRRHAASALEPPIAATVGRVTRHAAAPLGRMLGRWLTGGAVDDPYGEFFIVDVRELPSAPQGGAGGGGGGGVRDVGPAGGGDGGGGGGGGGGDGAAPRSSRDADIWFRRYRVRRDMVPAPVSRELVDAILLAGKTVRFLCDACDDGAWVHTHHAPAVALNEVVTDSLFGGALKGARGGGGWAPPLAPQCCQRGHRLYGR
ncbi:hypothetical protein I4F81_008291 [Pyropia yezoensis]|uniref:Uncharacterized protein n=1 Tax=Pyropia yezoensis TaxID=2788 RepID=A0ACC3C7C3_PYRYE|nr:hypothetical protein I4F81_008291 [Neopyropia yezoensis]